jgi:hypothetical protein
MQRVLIFVWLSAAAALLSGCPFEANDEQSCSKDSHCGPGFACDVPTGLCGLVPTCNRPSECAAGETCSRAGTCQLGDCSWADIGCVQGWACSADTGRWACVPDDGAAGAGGVNGDPGAGSGASPAGAAGEVDNASAGSGGAT